MGPDFFCILIAIFSCAAAAKYDIELLKFEILPDQTDLNYVDPGTWRLKQEGRNKFVISGTGYVKHSFSQRDKVKVSYKRKLSNGRYLLLYTGTYTVCELTTQNFYETVAAKSNVPYPAKCPIPKANISIENLVLDETFYPVVLPTGENAITMDFFVDGRVIFALKLESFVKVI